MRNIIEIASEILGEKVSEIDQKFHYTEGFNQYGFKEYEPTGGSTTTIWFEGHKRFKVETAKNNELSETVKKIKEIYDKERNITTRFYPSNSLGENMGQFEEEEDFERSIYKCIKPTPKITSNPWPKMNIGKMTTPKQRYLSPRGHEVTIIRETDSSVTLMVYDNPNDPHEWTTTKQNFEKNYKPL